MDPKARAVAKEAEEATRSLLEVHARYAEKLASEAELAKALRFFEFAVAQLEVLDSEYAAELREEAAPMTKPPKKKRKVDTSVKQRMPAPTVVAKPPPPEVLPWKPTPTPPPKESFPDLLPEDLDSELPTVREVEEAIEEAVEEAAEVFSKKSSGVPWVWVGVGVLAFLVLKKGNKK